MSTPAPAVRFKDHRPEPANLWVRYTAVLPPPAEAIWTNLATGVLGGLAESGEGTGRQVRPTDLIYLPPTMADDRTDDLVTWCDDRGIPTLVQHVVGLEHVPQHGSLSVIAHDLLAVLLGGSPGDLALTAPGGIAVWPVIAGLTDAPQLLETGLEAARTSGMRHVVPIPVELTPAAGRRLTEAFGDHLFDAVFHAGSADVRPIARAIHDTGLDFLPPRPPLPGALSANRRIATELAMIGELWTSSADSPAAAQEFFRAAAWLEGTHHDVVALAREGNLSIVPSLSGRVREVVAEVAESDGRSRVLRELVSRYVLDDS